jgi:tryptophan synthase alpha chain
MDNRYHHCFTKLRQTGRKALIPFTLLGWPDKQLSLEIAKTMIDSGASALELGWAFSDPLADGKTIQAAAFETLATGFTVNDALQLTSEIRAYNSDIPIGFLLYYNMLLAQGAASFFKQAAAAGVDGVLIADLPPESAAEVIPHARANNIAPIFMVSPLTSTQRLPTLLQYAQGFLYLVSRLGITGQSGDFDSRLKETLQTVRQQSSLPICVGFGVSTPQQARSIIDMGADGVITGSAIIELINQARDSGDVLTPLKTYLQTMRQALNPAG